MNRPFQAATAGWLLTLAVAAQTNDVAIFGDVVHTLRGRPITNGAVLVRGGRIVEVGPRTSIRIPDGIPTLSAARVVPGLIDAHSTVGFSGLLNQNHDQDQLDRTGPIQPELRAIDAYNGRDPLVDFVRSLGVTTLHTGHAPGALISGQTLIVKTHPPSVEEAVVVRSAMIAATLGSAAVSEKPDKAPGTRAKAVAMLRGELIKAQEYARKMAATDPEKRPARDLRLEALQTLLDRQTPLLVHVSEHHDILAALRLAGEFNLRVVLDGIPDAALVMNEIRKSGFPVVVHPSMWRPFREARNLSLETPARLQAAGIPFAFQSGYETYVPKTRIVLFEAAVAAANGLGFEETLHGLTLGAAQILGISGRVGSLEPGKDGDLALYDGDPFEYTTHCVGVVVNGVITDRGPK